MPLHIICVIEASLSEPHIDHDNGPQAWNNCIWVSIYVSFTCTPHLSHPGSRDPCTPWNASCIPVHWHAHVRELQLHLTQRPMLKWTARKTGATCVCHKDYRWRQVGECADTCINGFSLLRRATQKPSAGFWGIKLSDKVLPSPESFDLYFYCGSW